MSHKIKENMEELQAEIKKLCEEPITYRSCERLISCHKAYKILCENYGRRDREAEHARDDVYKVDVSVKDGWPPRFDRRMAMAWTASMVNADGTTGPHWNMEQTNDAMKKHGVTADPDVWYAVMNALYSDYCDALKKNNASTMDVYVSLAKAWVQDRDAVPDKAAAYYTHIVEH